MVFAAASFADNKCCSSSVSVEWPLTGQGDNTSAHELLAITAQPEKYKKLELCWCCSAV